LGSVGGLGRGAAAVPVAIGFDPSRVTGRGAAADGGGGGAPGARGFGAVDAGPCAPAVLPSPRSRALPSDTVRQDRTGPRSGATPTADRRRRRRDRRRSVPLNCTSGQPPCSGYVRRSTIRRRGPPRVRSSMRGAP
jgi:hypothetical protein